MIKSKSEPNKRLKLEDDNPQDHIKRFDACHNNFGANIDEIKSNECKSPNSGKLDH